MPQTKKNWVNVLKTIVWTNQIRNLIWSRFEKEDLNLNQLQNMHSEILRSNKLHEDSLLPMEVLPTPTDLERWWSTNGDGSDIDKGQWSRFIRGVRQPGRANRKNITDVIANNFGESWKKTLDDLWEHGPDGAPLWISLNNNDEKIIKEWRKYLARLSQLYTGPASETINDVAMGFSSVKTKNKIDPITKTEIPLWTRGKPSTGWRLAAAVAVLRLNWYGYVHDSRKKLSIHPEPVIEHDITFPAFYFMGIDSRFIISKMNEELEQDRQKKKEKRDKLRKTFASIIPTDFYDSQST